MKPPKPKFSNPLFNETAQKAFWKQQIARANKPLIAQEMQRAPVESEEVLDHPCRQTCSGWTQGFDRGCEAGVSLRKEIDLLRTAMWQPQHLKEKTLAEADRVKKFRGE